jgi:hypothetical protein
MLFLGGLRCWHGPLCIKLAKLLVQWVLTQVTPDVNVHADTAGGVAHTYIQGTCFEMRTRSAGLREGGRTVAYLLKWQTVGSEWTATCLW